MSLPKLLARQRRGLGLVLALVALGQAGLAAAFSEAISDLAGLAGGAAGSAAMLAMLLGLAMGWAMLAERWAAERFAQSFVLDCRMALFDAVIRNRGEGKEGRWLTALVGDLTALRNYAVRGSVKLWTSMLAGLAASAWLVQSDPAVGVALLPILGGFALVVLVRGPLRKTIALQRNARGRLNRFVIRRVRLEMADAPCPRGHGQRRLATLSGELKAKVERRALIFGTMEFFAVAAGAFAATLLLAGAQSGAEAVGQISLIGFIASRLLETTRALHAQAGGGIALEKLSRLLAHRPRAGVDSELTPTLGQN